MKYLQKTLQWLSKNDIYMLQLNMELPVFLQPYLASYDLSKLDLNNDKKLIITEILNKGDGKGLKWLSENYSQEDIKQVVVNPIRGLWLKSVLRYWMKIFEINHNSEVFNSSTINLNS